MTRSAVTLEPIDQWRDKNGKFHDIATMETGHIFNVIRMLWNHSMPEDIQFRPFNVYNFGSFYTAEYMSRMLELMLAELPRREDCSDGQLIQLNEMNRRALLMINRRRLL